MDTEASPTPPDEARAPAPRPRRSFPRPTVRQALIGAAVVLLVSAAAFAALALAPVRGLDLRTIRMLPGEGSVVYDRNGRELGRFFVENRHVVRLAALPKSLRDAFIAVEDVRFYQHHGVDWRRTGGAMMANLASGRRAQGSSTLTMQLARNLYPDLLPRTKSFTRKFREMAVARALERAFPKDQLLEAYLNTIYLGAGAYGVDAAARTYFSKSAAELTLPEAALLAALPKAPSSLNPFTNPEGALRRRNLVLDRMVEAGYLRADSARAAQAAPIHVVKSEQEDERRATTNVAPYFVEFVRQRLQARFGDTLYRGGLKIYTTLDADLEAKVEAALEAQARRVERGTFGALDAPRRGAKPDTALAGLEGGAGTPYLQAGAVVLDADSGDVLALVGGRSYEESPFNRMTQAKRQPGSAFKPFVYAAALADGMTPESIVNDDPISITLPDGTLWKPANFDVGVSHSGGNVTLRRALMQSRNRAAVRLAEQVGLDRVRSAATHAGIPGPLPAVPSLALGSADVRPLDLIVAYAPFIRDDGRQLVPRFVTRVVSHEGALIYGEAVRTRPGLDSAAALATRDLLAAVIDHGTGWPIRQSGFTGPAVGKTGTTNGSTDLWFVGGVPHLVGGVWFGFDQPRAILGGEYGTGGQIAAPAWAAVMKAARATRGRRIEPWPGNWQPHYPPPTPEEAAAIAHDDSIEAARAAADSAAAASDSARARNDSAAANL